MACGQNSAEQKLNGIWYETENPDIKWIFSPNHLEFIDDDNSKVEWFATESTIEFTYRTYMWEGAKKTIKNEDNILIEYALSQNDDVLSGTLTNRNGKYDFELIRIE